MTPYYLYDLCFILKMSTESKIRRGFDETSSVPIPQRSPLEVSQKGANDKINTMLKFSENLILQNIKMKKIIVDLAERINKLESVILNGKLQKTIEEVVGKRDKTRGIFTNTKVPSVLEPPIAPLNETKQASFAEHVKAISAIQQTKTPGQESTQNLMEALQSHQMLTTPEVNLILKEKKQEDSDNDSTNSGIHGAASVDSLPSEASATSTNSSFIVIESFKGPQNEPQPQEPQKNEPQKNEQPQNEPQQERTITENKNTIDVTSGDIILELEPIENTEQKDPQHSEVTTQPTEMQNLAPTETQNTSTVEPSKQEEHNPLVASSRRRKKKT